MIDNRYALETPEGIDIMLTPAGIGVRTMAFVVDLLIRGVVLFAASMALQFTGNMGQGLFFILLFCLEWFYPVLFEIYRGATPGKKYFGLIVVYDNGLPITLPGSMLRNLFRSIDILPFAYLSGFVAILCSKQFKRIGDHVAGTMVVYQDTPSKVEHFTVDELPQITLSLTLEEQQTIVAYAERSHSFSEERLQELANQLEPMLECRGEEAVVKLKAMAAGLVGKV
ncbi:RDD family protein [uncultured Paraglaciecola sp.]|uniref:RDD family protein n=1 Tax=uncultured Paraglaciecola sp. TaxID=1765024 RepID=UPI002593CDE1|nr:RDD family protein [uncultured Paraglaciecola sp.]